MSFHYKKEVISPEVLQELYSLTPEQKEQKRNSRCTNPRNYYR